MCNYAHMNAAKIAARDFVKRLLAETGEDLTTLARGAGLAPSTLTRPFGESSQGDKAEKHKFTLSQTSITKLEQRWGVLHKPIDTARPIRRLIPVVGYIGAGEQVYPVDDGPNGSGLEEIDAPPGASPGSVAVIVRGDSMFPAFWEGDVLIYTRNVPFDRERCLHNECVVKVKDGPTYVKRVDPGSRANLFTLSSYNAPPILDAPIEWASPVEFRDQRRRAGKAKWPLRIK